MYHKLHPSRGLGGGETASETSHLPLGPSSLGFGWTQPRLPGPEPWQVAWDESIGEEHFWFIHISRMCLPSPNSAWPSDFLGPRGHIAEIPVLDRILTPPHSMPP